MADESVLRENKEGHLNIYQVLFPEDQCFPVRCNENIFVSEFISVCKETYVTKTASDDGPRMEEEDNHYQIFSNNKGIWLDETKSLSCYKIDVYDKLQFAVKPKLLHICLPHVRRCSVVRYTKETKVAELLDKLSRKTSDGELFLSPDSNASTMGLFLLNGETNKQVIKKAKEEIQDDMKRVVSCNVQRDDQIDEEDDDGRYQEEALLEKIFTSQDCATIIRSHAERYQIDHIHPLDLLSDGLSMDSGIWLDPQKTLREYEISQEENNIVLYSVNPSLCTLESKLLDNFVTVFNPELESTKRKKFSFDTTVEEYTMQLCRTFQLNPHQKNYGLFYPPVNDQVGSWLATGSNLISNALNKNYPIEFRKYDQSSTANKPITMEMNCICLYDEGFLFIDHLSRNVSKYSQSSSHSFTVEYDLDTLVIHTRKQMLQYFREKNGKLEPTKTCLYLVRNEKQAPLLLKDENSLVSYFITEQSFLVLAGMKMATLSEIIQVKLPSIVLEGDTTSKSTTKKGGGFHIQSYCNKLSSDNLYNVDSSKTVQNTVQEITSRHKLIENEDIYKNSYTTNDGSSHGDDIEGQKTNTSSYYVLFQPSTTDMPDKHLDSSSAKIEEYNIKSTLQITSNNTREGGEVGSAVSRTKRPQISILLSFDEDDPVFTPKILNTIKLDEDTGKRIIQVEISHHTTVLQLLEEIVERLDPEILEKFSLQSIISELCLFQRVEDRSANQSPEFRHIPLKQSRIVSSYGITEGEIITCSRCKFTIQTILRLTSISSESMKSSMFYLQPTIQTSSHSRVSTVTLSNSLVTPKELISKLISQTEQQEIENYYGVYLPREERWLDSAVSFLKNNVKSRDMLDIKIKPERMRVVYSDLADKSSAEFNKEILFTIDVDYTIPILEIVFSQLLGTLNCNRRDLMEVRLVEESLSCPDDSRKMSLTHQHEKDEPDGVSMMDSENENKKDNEDGVKSTLLLDPNDSQHLPKSIDIPENSSFEPHKRYGKLLKIEESLAMQGIHPGDYKLYIFRLELGNTISESNEDVDINIWESAGQNDIIMESRNNKTIVTAGTLNKLVEYLTTNARSDQNFMTTFLLTYPMFSSSEMIFKKFMQRFQVPKPVDLDQTEFVNTRQLPIRLRVVSAMKHWVEHCGSTFDEDLLNSIQMFISNCVDQEGLPQVAAILRTAIKKVTTGITITKAKQAPISGPPTIHYSNKDSISLKFTDFDDEEIAKQLTLIAHKLFCSVKSTEFLNQAWTKPKYHYRCPNLLAAIERFNTESQWVSTMIINVPSTKARAKVMAKFINIAKHLKTMHNYNSVMAFIAALNTAAVSRLKWTKKELSKRSLDTLQELEKFMSNEMNYKQYRNNVSSVTDACVPYLGVHLSDLIFIEEGNSKYLENSNLVNFEMCQQVCDVISLLKKLQGVSYTAKSVPELMVLLTDLPTMNEKPLYQLSLKREPRGKIPPDLEKDSAGWDKKIGGFLRHDKDK